MKKKSVQKKSQPRKSKARTKEIAAKPVTAKAKTSKLSAKLSVKKPAVKSKIPGKSKADELLSRISPAVQKQMDQLKSTLEKSPGHIADLKLIAFKVLDRARAFSVNLKAQKKQKTKVRKKGKE